MKKEIKEQKTKESLASKILRYTDFSDGMKSVLSFSLTSKGKIRTVLVGGVKKIKKYDENLLKLEKLKKYGLTSVRSSRHIPEKLSKYIKECDL